MYEIHPSSNSRRHHAWLKRIQFTFNLPNSHPTQWTANNGLWKSWLLALYPKPVQFSCLRLSHCNMDTHWTKICRVCPEVCNADVAPNLTKRVAATPVSVFWKKSHWEKDSWFPMHIRSLLEASHKSLPMPMPCITSSQLQPLDLRLRDLHLEQFQNQICPSSQLTDLSHRQSTMFHSDLQDIAETWLRSQRAEGDDPGASVKHVNL